MTLLYRIFVAFAINILISLYNDEEKSLSLFCVLFLKHRKKHTKRSPFEKQKKGTRFSVFKRGEVALLRFLGCKAIIAFCDKNKNVFFRLLYGKIPVERVKAEKDVFVQLGFLRKIINSSPCFRNRCNGRCGSLCPSSGKREAAPARWW